MLGRTGILPSLARGVWPYIRNLDLDKRPVPPGLTDRTACPSSAWLLSCELLVVPAAYIK
jgi:hypothetical protein